GAATPREARRGRFGDYLAGAGNEEVDRESDHAHRGDCEAERREKRRRHHVGMGVWIESHGRRDRGLTMDQKGQPVDPGGEYLLALLSTRAARSNDKQPSVHTP